MGQPDRSANGWRSLWRDGTAILSRDGNRLRFISAILTVATVILPYLLLLQLRELLLSSVYLSDGGKVPVFFCTEALLLLLTVFLTLPLLSGLFYLAERMEAGEKTALPDVFHAFTDGAAYRVGLRTGLCMAFPLAVLIAAPRAVIALLSGFAGQQPLRWLLVAFAAVATDLLLFVLLLGGFRWIYAGFRHEKGQKSGGRSARRVGLWFSVRFLPHLILSVLSLLIYLIADILPRMLISYFRLCRMSAGAVTIDDASIGG